jgi:predicted transcriptional regulator YdeE
MVAWEVPAQTYAAFPANDVPDLGRVFHHSYSVWLPQSKVYELADGPWLEVYPPTYGQDHVIYVYCPVRRKSGTER